MSLPTQREAEAFLTPLRSKSTVFLFDNRTTDRLFSRFLLSCLVRTRNEALVADINAFYSSNAQRIAPESDALQNISLSLPPPGFAVEPWLIDFLIGAADAAVPGLGDVTTAYHLLSFGEPVRIGPQRDFVTVHIPVLCRPLPPSPISNLYS